MHSLTCKERFNKKKGQGKNGRKRKFSPHIFKTERWVVTPVHGLKQAFLTEHHAIRVAQAMAIEFNANIEIDRQVKNESGEWISD